MEEYIPILLTLLPKMCVRCTNMLVLYLRFEHTITRSDENSSKPSSRILKDLKEDVEKYGYSIEDDCVSSSEVQFVCTYKITKYLVIHCSGNFCLMRRTNVKKMQWIC